jgi:hypothetical protein
LKLPKPFFRLPVRFDAERLRAEVEALPTGAWAHNPEDGESDATARLITVGGAQDDRVVGPMKPTAALMASPYHQQVLASFDTVWSRSRLVRVDGGSATPPRSDTGYHDFYRVRLHVPVITRREVRFQSDDQAVHMADGEAWVIDNGRRHRLENPVGEPCVHLVADTAGTSQFWRLITQGQSGGFEQPQPGARVVAFDPAARPRLMTEQFNVWPLMPPAELEQLAFGLLSQLVPADQSPQARAAVTAFSSVFVEFCRDWRSSWYLHGDAVSAQAQFEALADAARAGLRRLPPVAVAGSERNALPVFESRVLALLFGDTGDAPVKSQQDEPTLSGLPTVELPQIELPTVEVPRIRSPEPHRPPVLERPIVILSAPRAGSTLLFETLAQAEGVYTIGGESHQLIESIAALRPGRGVVNSNRLTRRDATTAIVAELRQRFAGRIHDRDLQPPAPGAPVRLLEKTPKNALRVPFLLEVFPDAQFIFLKREPRANLSSMMEAWRAKGWITYRGLPGWPGPWSLLLPPGYERLKGRPLEEIVAFQWRVANETILDDLAELPYGRWTTVRYEAFLADPRTQVAKLLEFAGLAMDPRLEAYLSNPLPLSKYTQTKPDPDKWRQNAQEIERVIPQLEPIIGRLNE